MKILVRAKPSAKETKVELITQSPLDFGSSKVDMPVYRVSVTQQPTGGRANEAIIKALAQHFATSTSRIHLISGHTSRQKIFEIDR